MKVLFDAIINARDLGGMTGHQGRKVRSGMLLRTSHLHDASDEDIRRLRDEFHLRRIFDFRSFSQARLMPALLSSKYMVLVMEMVAATFSTSWLVPM